MQKSLLNKTIFIPKFYCFSIYEKNILRKTDAEISEFNPSGSLKAGIFLNINKDKEDFNHKFNFDICLLAEAAPRFTGDVLGYKDYQEIPGVVANLTHKLCKKNNLNLVFASKFFSNEVYFNEEYEYYKYFLKDHDFKIIPKDNFLSTFEKAFQSNVIVGHSSTALREIFSFKKKVLQWNYSKNIHLIEPFSGPSYLEGSDYDLFEKRILNLLKLTYDEYQKKLSSNISIIDNSDEIISKFRKI